MNFKKRVNGSWTDVPHYISGTDTETITTLPTTIYPLAQTATIGLRGNTIQNGTPTPDNPVMPQGTGERTGNLFDITPNANIGYNQDVGSDVSENPGLLRVSASDNGMILTADSSWAGTAWKIQARVGMTYYISFWSMSSNLRATIYTADGNNKVTRKIANYANNFPDNKRLTILSDERYIVISISVNAIATVEITKPMIATDIIPYEPYGYKIPISSANTTTPVYLGEVESTRRIKKYVFTGEENGTIYSTGTSRKGIEIAGITGIIGGTADIAILAICTHYQPNTRNALYRNTDNGISNAYQNDKIIFYDASCQTVEAFQQFCTQQYANGTPVTVWYVLAEPTTAIVNEPLRKIGDYADEVSGITIPTIAGANTISVDTTLQPSEVSVNYKGWHPVADVHEKSKNLFDKDKRTDNSRVVYTTGEIGTLNGTFVSDFTPIEPNTTYTLNIVSSISGKTGHLFALYDENKDFVNTGTHEATSTTVYTFTTPSNVAYIRFNGDMSSVDSTMLNSSSTALPYEPYWT